MPKGAICSLFVYPDPPPGDFQISFSFGVSKGNFLSILGFQKMGKKPFEGPIDFEQEKYLKILRERIKI